MKLSSTHLNQSGQIVGFHVHDSLLLDFEYKSGDSLTLRAIRDDQAEITIRCLGVGILGTIKLQLPDSILEVFAWHPDETPEGTLTLSDGAWNVLFAQDVQPRDLPNAVSGALAKHSARYLFHVALSYGGMISALCDDIFVEVASPVSRPE